MELPDSAANGVAPAYGWADAVVRIYVAVKAGVGSAGTPFREMQLKDAADACPRTPTFPGLGAGARETVQALNGELSAAVPGEAVRPNDAALYLALIGQPPDERSPLAVVSAELAAAVRQAQPAALRDMRRSALKAIADVQQPTTETYLRLGYALTVLAVADAQLGDRRLQAELLGLVRNPLEKHERDASAPSPEQPTRASQQQIQKGRRRSGR